MDLNKPLDMMTASDRRLVEKHVAIARKFGSPRRVWVEDGHVFVEGADGETVSMSPATAIDMGRRLSDAGADAVVNQVMDDGVATARKTADG